MANTGLVVLGSLRIQSQQRADMVNSGFVTTAEWNGYLSSSYKELFDLLITSYGDDYNVAAPFTFQTSNGTNLYALPDGTIADFITSAIAVPFYKLLGADLRVTVSPDSWITLRRFEFTERNRWQTSNLYTVLSQPTFRYKVVGSNIWLTPIPQNSQVVQLWYIPKPTNLMPIVNVATNGTTTVTCTDTSQLAVGMSVADLILPQGGSQVFASNATITAITPNTSFTLNVAANLTMSRYLAAFWSDLTTLDGVSGWEEYIVIDAALKALTKEESPLVPEVMAEKAAMKQRIIDTAANRDAGLPARVTDTESVEVGYPGFGGFFGGGTDW